MSGPAEQLFERLLVLRCQTGDEQAYRELIERFGPRLRYFLGKLLPHGDRAEDVLQETWIDVFRQLPRLRDSGAFTPWVYRIARGKAMLDLRQNGQAPSTTELVELAISPPDEMDFSSEDAAEIHRALDQLPCEHREVLVLRFLEEMSYEEICQVIRCPLGTVRSRIHYAKLALAKLLEHTNEK